MIHYGDLAAWQAYLLQSGPWYQDFSRRSLPRADSRIKAMGSCAALFGAALVGNV